MFTFSSVDLLNATITSGHTSYRTKTSVGFRGRKTTTLAVLNGSEQRIVGGIDWREKDFVIGGKTWDLFALKTRPSNSQTMRVWHWAGDDFRVHLNDRQWMAVSMRGQNQTTIATLNQSVQKIFKTSQPATLSFHVELSEINTIFFLLVMIYTEVRWQDDQVDGHLKSEDSD